MNKLTVIILSVISFAILVAIIGFSASNKEVSTRSKITAQKQVCEASFDKMWKVVSQTAEVPDQYKNGFKEIYSDLIQGRYGNDKGGSLMRFITESNPNFDVSLYKQLVMVIESERASFFNEQKLLIDLNNQHRVLKNTFPNSIFIGSRPDIQITVVSSDVTKRVMESGTENDIQLFKK